MVYLQLDFYKDCLVISENFNCMMVNREELKKYVIENFEDITHNFDNESHISGFCSNCKKIVGFQIIERFVAVCNERRSGYHKLYDSDYFPPYSIFYRCPICSKFKITIVFEILESLNGGSNLGGSISKRIYKVTSIPNDRMNDIDYLPENSESLKKAYFEAIRCLDSGCNLAAAAMLRRALQIITREILGASPGTLAGELKEIVKKGKENSLGVALTNDFAENSFIVKECGNQAAHPDSDIDLLEFELEDANNLYNIFIEIVSELFVVPKAAQKARDQLLEKRKIVPIYSDNVDKKEH